jgi:GalNAc-alpha-(1->4)-GalNAc-alpha-(1->3)-diNAcBac-PP-undecaprenol alpha-1,4-N-acetyl-D-galactosaminyltransferase
MYIILLLLIVLDTYPLQNDIKARQMHIALIISSLSPGGAERVLSQLANAWVSGGHKILIITFSAPSALPFYHLDERVYLYQLDQLVREKSSPLCRLKNIIKRILKLRQAVKRVKPDVVISFVDVTNITALLAGIRLQVPFIVCERTHPQYYRLPAVYNRLRLMTYFWADKVICQTTSAAGYFKNISHRKKAIIPNYVKKPEYQKKEADVLRPVQKIISAGRLCPHKGFATLITAFSEIVHHKPDLTLTIYGEGEERQNLEALILKLNLTTHVFLPGIVQDIENVMIQADLFVFPSHYEGFPNVLCEAMAVGLPVIASNGSGNIDIIREGIDGRVFVVGDAEQLKKLMEELIEDAPQRVKLSKGAIALPDRFSQASILEIWDAVLREATGLSKP